MICQGKSSKEKPGPKNTHHSGTSTPEAFPLNLHIKLLYENTLIK